MKEPVRLGKVEPNPYDVEKWMLLHPTAIILGISLTLFLVGALIFACTGHAAVESGGLRNFIAMGC